MDTSRARVALEAWLAQVEEILREEERDGELWDEESVEHGNAA